MNFIDTHIHLQDFKQIYTKDIIASALSMGVKKFLCVSSSLEDWKKVEELYNKYPDYIVPAFGVHPWYVKEEKEDTYSCLEEMLKKYPSALVGEIGLDGYKDMNGQIEAFERQLFIAREYSRPIVIHSLKSQNWFEQNWRLLPDKFVFHSYNGKKEFLKEIISHNGYVSFSFSVLRNKEFKELVNMVPIHRLLIETDSPYQGVEKDSENEPSKLPNLFSEIAKAGNADREKLAEQIYKNSLEFMGVE